MTAFDTAWELVKAPQYVLQDAHLPHKPFPDLPEGMPPQNVAMFQEHWGGEEGGAPPKGFHEKYNLHPDAKVSMYDIGRNTTHGWKPGTDQMKYHDDSYANQFKNKLSQVSPDATHVIANTGHSYPIGAALPQGSNINDVQQQQQGFPANQARWDRQRPSYEAIQQPQDKQTGEPMDLAWRLLKMPVIKADEWVYYDVHITPINQDEDFAIWQLKAQLEERGIVFDSGGGLGGYNWHLDYSLRGATPNQVLRALKNTGVSHKIEMFVSKNAPDSQESFTGFGDLLGGME